MSNSRQPHGLRTGDDAPTNKRGAAVKRSRLISRLGAIVAFAIPLALLRALPTPAGDGSTTTRTTSVQVSGSPLPTLSPIPLPTLSPIPTVSPIPTLSLPTVPPPSQLP